VDNAGGGGNGAIFTKGKPSKEKKADLNTTKKEGDSMGGHGEKKVCRAYRDC